jgi:SAM-dependent methyltransferase
MQIMNATRVVVRRILGSRLTDIVRRPFRPRLRTIADYRSALRSRRGLEIGGPSPMLASAGEVPVYDVLGSLDNCLYSGSTIWTGAVTEGATFVYDSGKRPGAQIICDGTNLKLVSDFSYGCVLACHCLEHVANPLRALEEWKRVLQEDGLLLLILPHKDGTFDWRRPVTPLAHIIEDYQNAVGEDDLTHLPEILELHDLSKDKPAGTKEQFRQRCLSNEINRAMHHHVFDTMAALAIVDYAGFQVLRVDNLKPFHIIILASKTKRTADNRRFMKAGLEHREPKPFPIGP